MTAIEPIDLRTRLDPTHQAILDVLPQGLLELGDVDGTRAILDELLAAMPSEMPDDVTVEDLHVPGLEGDPDVLVRLYRPDGLPADSPALYWVHGGGMVLGSVDMSDAECASRARNHQCLVASVDYRLAPEHPFPAPMHDCFAGLQWLASNTAELGVDAGRIAIGGASAGGGLAAGLALMARDQGGPDICFQLLVFPMLDHRNVTPSSHAITDTRVWNREANIVGWRCYLGDGDEVSPYASPSIADDLSGLPPAYINVGDLDMFVDEDIAYAQALRMSGVAAELHVYPGAFHGSNGFAADAPLSRRWAADEAAALQAALHPVD